MNPGQETLASRAGWAALTGVLVTLQRIGSDFQRGRLSWRAVVGYVTATALICFVATQVADAYEFTRAQTTVLTAVLLSVGVFNLEKLIKFAVFRWAGAPLPEEPVNVPQPPSDAIAPRNAGGGRRRALTARESPIAQFGAKIAPPISKPGEDPDQDLLDQLPRHRLGDE